MVYTKKSTVQIPLSLFLDIMDFVSDPKEYEFMQEELGSDLREKYDAIVRRALFTKYKTSDVDSIEREQFRREYLDKAGITRMYRSKEECPN